MAVTDEDDSSSETSGDTNPTLSCVIEMETENGQQDREAGQHLHFILLDYYFIYLKQKIFYYT